MLFTILITLMVFVGFMVVVSYFFSYATNMSLSLTDTLIGAFTIAFLFMLIQFLVSPYIVRASARLHYIQPDENAWLDGLVTHLANSAGVKKPRIAISPDPTPNAFVFGNSTNNMTLAVNEGLLRNLNENEITGVIGHELGHIRHKDSIVMTFLAVIPLIAYIIVQMAFRASFYSGMGGGRRSSRDDRGGNAALLILAAGVIALIVYFVSQLLVLRLSRLREQFADAFSAYLTKSPRDLASALTRITYGLSLSPQEAHGARALYISDPALAKQEVQEILQQKNRYDLDQNGVLDEHELQLAMEQEARSRWRSVNEMFATHPPTYKRLLLLKQIDQEISSRSQ
jgi:heat shock protein HtpX